MSPLPIAFQGAFPREPKEGQTMWNALLNVAGWVFFYLLILLYVRGSILEQSVFSGEDPENWEGGRMRPGEPPADRGYHLPAWRLQPHA